MDKRRIYLCIDLKTFYASVECAERGLDTFNDNLVVADSTRGNGALCLAITQHMKNLGIKNRCRLYEIPKNVKYIIAKPRMQLYIETSAKIYAIYLRYISSDDIHPYSIDEMFLDVTDYLHLYKKTPRQMAEFLMGRIKEELNICATAGIGTNLFLAKVALDIKSKHNSSNIGVLDEERFRKELWEHQPLSDFWQIAGGLERRLNRLGIYTMKDLALYDEDIIYKEFGVNAEIMIDHAKGLEPVLIKHIKSYKTKSKSISLSQVLFEDYKTEDARLVVKEMVELLTLRLTEKHIVAGGVSLFIGYSKDIVPATGASMKLDFPANTFKTILPYFMLIFDKTIIHNVDIRRIGISFYQILPEDFEYFNLFVDSKVIKKERKLENTILSLKNKYGKNSILKAMNLMPKATTIKRNSLIGGHNAK